MKRLAIDTTGAKCSVALCIGDAFLQEVVTTPRQHAEKILEMVKTLLNEASLKLSNLDGIAFGRGPGSFTGLRIAASVTQGLAISHDIPVYPISSLAALAQGVYRESGYESVHAVFDARMGEVYWGSYQCIDGLMVPTQDEAVCSPETVKFEQDLTFVGAGSGFKTFIDTFKMNELITCFPEREPEARDMISLSIDEKPVTPEEALPIYLRNKVTRS